jgi:hypothetical protein
MHQDYYFLVLQIALLRGHLQDTEGNLFIGLFCCWVKTRNAINMLFTAFPN